MKKKSFMGLAISIIMAFTNGALRASLADNQKGSLAQVLPELEQKIKSFAERAEKSEWEAGLLGETKVPIDEGILKQMKAEFNASIKDSRTLGPKGISYDLTPVVPWNKDLIWSKDKKYVLVTSWMALPIMRAYYLSGLKGHQTTYDGLMWVTMAPTLKNFAKTYRPEDNNGLSLHYRLNQLLGLTPDTRAKYFVDLWVRPEDLMRPCVDSEVVDATCIYDAAYLNGKVWGAYNDIYNFAPEDEEHKLWYKKQRENETRATNGFPWTSLGYTYDWGSKTDDKFGVSEFGIRPKTSVYIQRVVPTDDYASSADIPSDVIEIQQVGRV